MSTHQVQEQREEQDPQDALPAGGRHRQRGRLALHRNCNDSTRAGTLGPEMRKGEMISRCMCRVAFGIAAVVTVVVVVMVVVSAAAAAAEASPHVCMRVYEALAGHYESGCPSMLKCKQGVVRGSDKGLKQSCCSTGVITACSTHG